MQTLCFSRNRVKILLFLLLFTGVTIAILFSYSRGDNVTVDYSIVYQPLDGAVNVINWSLKHYQLQLNKYRTIKNNNDRIFFHETSGRMQLSFKDTCAIESAALHNPQRSIEIFLQPHQQQEEDNKPINYSSIWLKVLDNYSNIQVIIIDDEKLYFQNSLLEYWYLGGRWRNSPYRLQHMADYIRTVSLKKEGGMYLDLDVITLKPYDNDRHLFWNFVTVPSAEMAVFTNAIIHLEQNHRLIDLIIEKQAEEYVPDDYTFNGPQALTAAILQLCNNKTSSPNCSGLIGFLPHHHFYPIGTAFCHTIFVRDDKQVIPEFNTNLERSHGLHFYNSITHNMTVDLAPNSVQMFARLAARHCPITLQFGHQFIID